MTATSGVNDTYRMYVTTKRDGVGFNLAYIDSDFTLPYKGPFDQGYMRTLVRVWIQQGQGRLSLAQDAARLSGVTLCA